MTIVAPPESDAVQHALHAASRIATLPQVAARVIELIEDPSSENAEIERVISADPVLCAKILKVANSPMYGFAQQVVTVRRAIDILGHQATRNVTIAVSMAKLFRGGVIVPGYGSEQIWHHSNAVGVLARLVADRFGASTDEALLAGLLHEIGIVVEMLVDREALADVFREVRRHPELDFRDAERRRFGTDHSELGAALCRNWSLPQSVCDAVAQHHDDQPTSNLASIVAVANWLNARDPLGFALDTGADALPSGVLDRVGATQDDVLELEESLGQADTSAPWEEK